MVLLDSLWFIPIAALLGGYAFVFGFLRRVNDFYYVGMLGRKTQYPLPPGDLGWPFLGNMQTFLKAFKSDPDSFIYDLVSRSPFFNFSSLIHTYITTCTHNILLILISKVLSKGP